MKKEKRLNVYIPVDIDMQLRSLDGTLKSNVCTILAQGLHIDAHGMCNNDNGYDKELLEFFQSQIKELQHKNEKLENQVEFHHVQDLSFWKRRRYNKQMKLLPMASTNPDSVDV